MSLPATGSCDGRIPSSLFVGQLTKPLQELGQEMWFVHETEPFGNDCTRTIPANKPSFMFQNQKLEEEAAMLSSEMRARMGDEGFSEGRASRVRILNHDTNP